MSQHDATRSTDTILDPSRVDAIIFDLGGVLLPLHQEATVKALSQLFGGDATAYYNRFEQADLFDLYERGEISSADFRTRLSALFEARRERRNGEAPETPAPTNTEIDVAWNALLGRLPASTVSLLARLREKVRVFLLSNTNEIHIQQFLADYRADHEARFGAFEGLFERVHYSHHLGMRKPEPRIYEHLLSLHGLSADRTVFVDDSETNAAAACRTGLVGIHHSRNTPIAPYFARFLS